MTLLAVTFSDEINDAIIEGIKQNKLPQNFEIQAESRRVLINKLIRIWERGADDKEAICQAVIVAYLRGYSEGKEK